MTSCQADRLWTLADEHTHMRGYEKWNLQAINRARVNVGLGELTTRQDAFRAYARGLRRRTDWSDIKKHVPGHGAVPERWDPLTRYDIAKLIDCADDMVGQFTNAADRFIGSHPAVLMSE